MNIGRSFPTGLHHNINIYLPIVAGCMAPVLRQLRINAPRMSQTAVDEKIYGWPKRVRRGRAGGSGSGGGGGGDKGLRAGPAA